MRLTYKEILESSKRGNESTMWDAVERVDCHIEKLRKTEPELAREFLQNEYEALNGQHLNEKIARKMVQMMHHTAADGSTVKGEAVTPDEAMTLIADKEVEKRAKCKWDAYVGANALAHDLGTTGLVKQEILKIAKAFWFNDEDFDNKHKVYWYFKDWIFE
jgi:DNA-directed RNA polymerase subunit F